MGLFPPCIIKGPTEHLYPRHAYRPISTKLPRGGNCPAFFGLDRCVRKKRDSLRRDPRLPAPLTVVARAGGSPIFAPICCIPTKSALKIGAHFRGFRVSHRLMATGSQIPFGNPLSLEILFLVTRCVTLSVWAEGKDCEVELRTLLRSQIKFGNERGGERAGRERAECNIGTSWKNRAFCRRFFPRCAIK